MSTGEPVERQAMTKPTEPVYSIAKLGDNLSLVKRKTVELTQEYAELFLELPQFVGDRTLRESHVMFLARQMDSGSFRWEQVNLVTCVCDGREYRMNGQHTCWARIYADTKKLKDVRTPVQQLQYSAATEQDMRQLYATIDRGAPRTRGNVVVSYLAGREEFPDYSKGLLRDLAQGLSMWLWETGEQRKLHTADEVSYLLLTTHHKTACRIGEFIRTSEIKDFKHMNRQPTIAAMFATASKAPDVSLDFWTIVRDGVGVSEKTDARYTLRNYLMTTTLNVSPGATDMKAASPELMYRACLQAWNSWRSHKPIRALTPHKLHERPAVK